MAVERVPGERVYIDWVGDQPELLVDAQMNTPGWNRQFDRASPTP